MSNLKYNQGQNKGVITTRLMPKDLPSASWGYSFYVNQSFSILHLSNYMALLKEYLNVILRIPKCSKIIYKNHIFSIVG